MKIPHGSRLLAVLVALLAMAGGWLLIRSAAEPITSGGARLHIKQTDASTATATLQVDTGQPGHEFADGAVGLSTETATLSYGRFRARHGSLVRLMRLLGPSVLRIGGNSVDSSWWTSSGEPPPRWASNTVTPSDLVALHGLLLATGWRVLLGVDLGHFEPTRAANEAVYAQQILGESLLGIELGNEPNDFSHRKDGLRSPSYGVSEYVREAEASVRALKAAAPGLAAYGPAAAQTTWLAQMGTAAGMFTELTQHFYPASPCSESTPSTAAISPTVAELLSPAVRQQENEALEALTRAGTMVDRPTRIGETGSAACTGNAAASSTFASALWALDWALRASSSGVQGLNFHGNLGACAPHAQDPICARSNAAVGAGQGIARPEYYGLLAARQLEGGRFVPISLDAAAPLPNLTAWATLAPDGIIRIAIDNLATVGAAQSVLLQISGYTASEERLTAPSAEATGGITLGRAYVRTGGRWRPTPVRLHSRHSLRVALRPASAVIITLRPARAHG
jgi:hypothetical protein